MGLLGSRRRRWIIVVGGRAWRGHDCGQGGCAAPKRALRREWWSRAPFVPGCGMLLYLILFVLFFLVLVVCFIFILVRGVIRVLFLVFFGGGRVRFVLALRALQAAAAAVAAQEAQVHEQRRRRRRLRRRRRPRHEPRASPQAAPGIRRAGGAQGSGGLWGRRRRAEQQRRARLPVLGGIRRGNQRQQRWCQ